MFFAQTHLANIIRTNLFNLNQRMLECNNLPLYLFYTKYWHKSTFFRQTLHNHYNKEWWDDTQIKGTDGNASSSTMKTLIAALHDKPVHQEKNVLSSSSALLRKYCIKRYTDHKSNISGVIIFNIRLFFLLLCLPVMH